MNSNILGELFNFKNKVIAITGGAGYLCSEMAINFLKLESKVIILDKNIKKINKKFFN